MTSAKLSHKFQWRRKTRALSGTPDATEAYAPRFACTLLAAPAIVLFGCSANDEVAKPARVSAPPAHPQTRCFSSLEVSMTERELEEFQRQRDQFRLLPWFQHTAPTTHMTQEQLRAARSESRDSLQRGLYVDLPSRLLLFNERHIQLDLHDDTSKLHLSRLSEAFPYFPELRTLTISNYEGQTNLIPLLRATYKATHLSSIKFLDGKLSSEQVAVLAEHPTLKALYLTRCHISLTDFALLARMKSLEELWLANGSAATPECFLTLVKLPKLRSVYLDAQDAFDVPISDDVQQAIKSLDGRLEEVVAQFPATVHPSLVSAILNVKSLRTLDIATVSEGLRFADVERLGDLTRLTRFNMTLAPDDDTVDLAERKKIDAVLIRTSGRAQERWKQIHQNRG